jgi:alkylation response protein AidB-like acyl-CoA dehydrogenase
MDVCLTPAQQLLAHSARSFLAQRWPPERAHSFAVDPRGFPADLWKEMAALGWTGLMIPPGLGGSGGSALDAIVLVEEMGRACLPSPFIPSAVVSTRILIEASPHKPARDLLPRLALGEAICAVAVLEEGGQFGGVASPLERSRIRGRSLFVADAHVATHLIVIGRGQRGLDAALLPIDRPGARAAALDSMSGDRLFEIDFDDVEVRAEDRLGPLGVDSVLALPAFVLGALAQAADMAGAAQRILDLCVEHARTRSQFGRPIGSFQAIQHACADLFRDVETSRWLTYEAAWRLEYRDDATLAATAKAYCSEAGLRVARRAHQIMGAIGYCEEHPLHLFHKRILAGSLAWGEPAQHLETVSRAMGLD